jgi:hypothetical protein
MPLLNPRLNDCAPKLRMVPGVFRPRFDSSWARLFQILGGEPWNELNPPMVEVARQAEQKRLSNWRAGGG